MPRDLRGVSPTCASCNRHTDLGSLGLYSGPWTPASQLWSWGLCRTVLTIAHGWESLCGSSAKNRAQHWSKEIWFGCSGEGKRISFTLPASPLHHGSYQSGPFLSHPIQNAEWWAMTRNGKKLREGQMGLLEDTEGTWVLLCHELHQKAHPQVTGESH